jgi:Zn-dependent protease
LTLGWVAGIRVRLHGLFLFFILFELLRALTNDGWMWTLSAVLPLELLLFTFVLLHEFGHCYGCRTVGGTADDVLIWPLGGLAFCDPPPRPLDHLVTTLAGPMVNLMSMVLLAPPLAFFGAFSPALFNPLRLPVDVQGPAFYLALAWYVNYCLLLFNMLLPIYPFDLGRVVQELLWFRFGFVRATAIATTIGMAGAVLLASVSLFAAGRFPGAETSFFLVTAIAIFGFIECVRVRRELELSGAVSAASESGYDFSEGYLSLERGASKTRNRAAGRSPLARFRQWLKQRRQRQEQQLEGELDRILEKIHQNGIESLSRAEKRTLIQASRRRRRE